MSRPETPRIALVQRGSGGAGSWGLGAGRRISFVSRTFGACALCAVLAVSCHSAKSKQGAPVASASASSHPIASGGGGSDHDPSHGSPPDTTGGEGPKAASPSALSAERRALLTTIRVSAHVGNVIIRREPGGWVISGRDGCTVRSARIERALDNLSGLKAVPTTEAVPDGAAFRLQITALVGEEPAVHLELADRNARGHLSRLDNDSMVRIQGLDVGLWSPHPADWCNPP
jgi:hypothetical protein